MVRLIDSNEVKTVLSFRFINFNSITQGEIYVDTMFEDKKIHFTAVVMGANVT
jgi:hypothetical protein